MAEFNGFSGGGNWRRDPSGYVQPQVSTDKILLLDGSLTGLTLYPGVNIISPTRDLLFFQFIERQNNYRFLIQNYANYFYFVVDNGLLIDSPELGPQADNSARDLGRYNNRWRRGYIGSILGVGSFTGDPSRVSGLTGAFAMIRDPNYPAIVINKAGVTDAEWEWTVGNAGDFILRHGAGNVLVVYLSSNKVEFASVIGIGKTPSGVGGVYLDLNGNYSAPVYSTSTTPYTIQGNESLLKVDATAEAITVNLPAAASYTGVEFCIKKIDSSANAVTIDTNGAETIDGTITYTLSSQWKYVRVRSDGTNWLITANN